MIVYTKNKFRGEEEKDGRRHRESIAKRRK
jgi:hypothetical protein